MYKLHFTLYNAQRTLYSVQLYITVQYVKCVSNTGYSEYKYNVQSILYLFTIRFTVYILHCTMYSIVCSLYLYSVQCTLYTLSMLYIVHCTYTVRRTTPVILQVYCKIHKLHY